MNNTLNFETDFPFPTSFRFGEYELFILLLVSRDPVCEIDSPFFLGKQIEFEWIGFQFIQPHEKKRIAIDARNMLFGEN